LGLTAELAGQVSVYDANGDKEGLSLKFEFAVDLNEPVNQNSAHFVIDLNLASHIMSIDSRLLLGAEKMRKNICSVLRAKLGVFDRFEIKLIAQKIAENLGILSLDERCFPTLLFHSQRYDFHSDYCS